MSKLSNFGLVRDVVLKKENGKIGCLVRFTEGTLMESNEPLIHINSTWIKCDS